MTRFHSLPAVLGLLAGCFVYADPAAGPRHGVNDAPHLSNVDASCYWDDYYGDYVWWFMVDAEDRDGADDVVVVYADVLDNWDGQVADSFELYPDQGVTWYSAWQERSTYLDCEYYDYTVVFTASDTAENEDAVELLVY